MPFSDIEKMISIGFCMYDKAQECWKERKIKKKKEVKVNHISSFWEAAMEGRINESCQVTIQGQLSVFAPFLIGSPKVKRECHLGYRRKVQKSTQKTEISKIDAMLAYTAGQMVWRLDIKRKFVMLGLYHSIIRNSIPIFVTNEYYTEKLEKIFKKSSNPYAIEAKIIGNVIEFPNEFIVDMANELKGLIKPSIVKKANKPVFAIMIDGDKTSIEYVSESRYLDGDIWVALEEKGEQFFVSRFINLADTYDLIESRNLLKEDRIKSHPDANILFEYDQVNKMFSDEETIISEFLENI